VDRTGGGEKSSGAPPGPPRTTTGRPAGHHRRRQQVHLHRAQGGGCGLGETLTAPPPLLLFGGTWAGWANQAMAGR
jgi:hypothetical protein